MAVTGGIHKAEDVVKSILVGANTTMMTSALLVRGIGYISHLYLDLLTWMENHEFGSIQEMQAHMSNWMVDVPDTFERSNYVKVLRSYATKE
jgi:dihydroorotate dehydrogenase (fumarate)